MKSAKQAAEETAAAKEINIRRMAELDELRRIAAGKKHDTDRQSALLVMPETLQRAGREIERAILLGNDEITITLTYPIPELINILCEELHSHGYATAKDINSDGHGPDLYYVTISWRNK